MLNASLMKENMISVVAFIETKLITYLLVLFLTA